MFVVATDGPAEHGVAGALGSVAGLEVIRAGDGTQGSLAALVAAAPDAAFVVIGEGLVPTGHGCMVLRERLFADTAAEVARVCVFLGVRYDQAMLGPVEAAARAAQGETIDETAFGSVFTETFADLLSRTASSVLITTYQTNRLVCVRAHGGALNTHLRTFQKPMGIAVAPGRIALGTRSEVWDLRDLPEAAAKLEPAGCHDACYLPRNRHVTGDIAVHEMAFADGELWLVATAFSCLATLDADHSFVPRWTPAFISSLADDDRCHLNGLAIRDDRPAFVTALAASDEPRGWRAQRAAGGVLIDVATGEIVVRGLSMPHSPRWHGGRLWLLESGRGTLCVADPHTGTVETVVELPGFTRGLAFLDGFALVGLSQIREASTFGELPLTSRLRDREAGVWMIDLSTGRVSGFLRFTDLVQEVFDVSVLPGVRYPEIAEHDGSATERTYVLP